MAVYNRSPERTAHADDRAPRGRLRRRREHTTSSSRRSRSRAPRSSWCRRARAPTPSSTQLVERVRAGRHHRRRRQRELPRHDPPREGGARDGHPLRRRRASPAARRARSTARRSCPAARPRPTRRSARSSRSIAAVAEGEPCVTHVGTDGAGHFVKMVHNGIEYADMQLIAEAYDLHPPRHRQDPGRDRRRLRRVEHGRARVATSSRSPPRCCARSDADDRQAARRRHPRRGGREGHRRVDRAERARPRRARSSGIAEAVFARSLSSQAAPSARPPSDLPGPAEAWTVAPDDADAFIEDVRRALYASKIVAYSQGFDEIVAGAEQYGWDIHKGDIAKIWRGGCIIRAQFLNRIADAYAEDPCARRARRAAPYFRRRASPARRTAGAGSSRSRRRPASPRPPSRRRSRTTTASVPSACPPR